MFGIGQLIKQLPDISLSVQRVLRVHSCSMLEAVDRQQSQERGSWSGENVQLQQIWMLNLQIPFSSYGN